MGFLFVPVYLHFLGAEGFGLIGFFTTISGIVSLMDAGFGGAANRQFARLDLTAQRDCVAARSLARSLEWLFWGAAFILGGIIIAIAPFIASRWLHTQYMGDKAVTDVLRLMGVTIIIQFPIAFYNGCLMGLQKQVRLNVLGATIATLRGVGGSLVLWLISPTALAFFISQLIVTLVNVVAARQMLWHALPKTNEPAAFSLLRLREIGHFALGLMGTNVFSLALGQLDKIILSTLLTLENFGHYMLATSMSILVLRVAGPVYNAAYPRMTELVARHESEKFYAFYRRSTQLVTLVVVPFALLLAFFSKELLTLWTHDAGIGTEVQWTQTWLVLSTTLSGIMCINGATLLAHGNFSKSFRATLVVALLIFPTTYFLTKSSGIEGAAVASLLLSIVNQSLLLKAVRQFLPAQLIRDWLVHAIAIPVGACATVYALMTWYLRHESSPNLTWQSIIPIALAYAASLVFVGLLLKTTRHELFAILRARTA